MGNIHHNNANNHKDTWRGNRPDDNHTDNNAHIIDDQNNCNGNAHHDTTNKGHQFISPSSCNGYPHSYHHDIIIVPIIIAILKDKEIKLLIPSSLSFPFSWETKPVVLILKKFNEK